MAREDSMPLIQVSIVVRISRDALRRLPGKIIEQVRDATVRELVAPSRRLLAESGAEAARQLRLLSEYGDDAGDQISADGELLPWLAAIVSLE